MSPREVEEASAPSAPEMASEATNAIKTIGKPYRHQKLAETVCGVLDGAP